VLLPWRQAVVCQKMAQRIQKRIRGFLARKWVADWFYTRNNIVIVWQAHSRRFVANKHTYPMLAREKAFATKIQKIIRGKLARLRCARLSRNLAATRIQTLWRGVVGRLFTDKLWLQATVIPVQSMYRKRLALKRFVSIKMEFNNAALKIQKKFRNWYSRRRLGDRLFVREMESRMFNIRMLTSEEELCQENLTKGMERLVNNKFKEKAQAATKALLTAESAIYMKECDLTEFKRQSEILSARAREQGFDVELEKNIKDCREELTALKLQYVFEQSAEVHRQDEVLEDQVAAIEQWAAHRNRVAEWRSDQYDERRHLNYKRELLARRRAKRIAVAEERRRWAVTYTTSDGKPDKKRRYGAPWDPSVFAGPDKAVYSGGAGVNLLAHIQKAKEVASAARGGGGGGGSAQTAAGSMDSTLRSVNQTLDQVGLQTYLEEVNLYEKLLAPIASIMQQTMGVNPMGLSNLAESGWGEQGDRALEAFQTIGIGIDEDAGGGGDGSSSHSSSRSGRGGNRSSRGSSALGGPLATLSRAPSYRCSSSSSSSHQKQQQRDGGSASRGSGGRSAPLLLMNGTASSNVGGDSSSIASTRQSSFSSLPVGSPAHDGMKVGGRMAAAAAGVLHSASRQTSFNSSGIADEGFSFDSGGGGGMEGTDSSAEPNPTPTAREILDAFKARKKKTRKSYLPALDAHSIMYEHQRPKKEQQRGIADELGDLDRLFKQQAAWQQELQEQQKAKAKEKEKEASRSSPTRRYAGSGLAGAGAGVVALDGGGGGASAAANNNKFKAASTTALVTSKLKNAIAAASSTAMGGAGHGSNEQQQQQGQGQGQGQGQAFWVDNTQAERAAEEARHRAYVEQRRSRKKQVVRSSTIPWQLLDELDGAKVRFENEMLYHDFNHKY
jgi:hypothetical protein